MKQLDTNVVVRLLIEDDPVQVAKLRALVSGQRLFVPATVLLETIWVLRSRYKLTRPHVVAACRHLAALPSIAVGDARAVAEMFRLWDAGVDLEDSLHLAHADFALLTFDKDFAKRAKKARAKVPVELI